MFITEGAYKSTLDGNGRLQLPTAILRELNPTAEGRVVINRSTEKCLTLYPLNVWIKYKERLNSLNPFIPANSRAIRYFMGSAAVVKIDSKNRILIPKPLSQYACLEKELLVVGMTGFLEIWDPKLYDAEMERFPTENSDTITQIATQIFEDGKFFE